MSGRIYINMIASGFLMCMCISSCELINPDETIPSYIYLKDFTFNCSDGQGYPSEKIIDGWVYANGIFIGAYELPATIPVLSSGPTEILVYAGIKENGISGVSMIYPFYSAYAVTADLTELETDTITPACTYKPSASLNFIYLEDFEIGNSLEGVENEAVWTKTFADENVFEGSASGAGTLIGENDTMRIKSNNLIFPTQDKLLFLEIDYKCDISYQVWINCNTGTGGTITSSVLTVTAKENWNKIYINLNPKLQFYSQYDPQSYNLEFRTTKPSDIDTASLFFDNLKIISSK